MIDLTSLLATIITGVFSVMAIVIPMWITSFLKDKQAASVLSTAVTNALGAMRQASEAGVRTLAPKVYVPGLSPEMTVGVNYVLDHAGDELKRFGITPEAVASKLNAKLGLQKIAAEGGAVPIVPPPVPVTSTLATAPMPGVGGQPMMPMRLPIPPRFPENAP